MFLLLMLFAGTLTFLTRIKLCLQVSYITLPILIFDMYVHIIWVSCRIFNCVSFVCFFWNLSLIFMSFVFHNLFLVPLYCAWLYEVWLLNNGTVLVENKLCRVSWKGLWEHWPWTVPNRSCKFHRSRPNSLLLHSVWRSCVFPVRRKNA
jgi:hypothetical protein